MTYNFQYDSTNVYTIAPAWSNIDLKPLQLIWGIDNNKPLAINLSNQTFNENIQENSILSNVLSFKCH